MDVKETLALRSRVEVCLGRLRDRQRAIGLLLAQGYYDDAKSLLEMSFKDFRDLKNILLDAVQGTSVRPAWDLAAARLERLECFAEGNREADWDELLASVDFAIDALDSLYFKLKRSSLRTAGDRRRQVALIAGALLCAVLLAAVGSWGPRALGDYQQKRNQAKIREVEGVLTELAGLGKNAKTASGKTLVALTGETCTDCPCGESRKLDTLYEFDLCRVRWNKVAAALVKAATGKDEVPKRFMLDPWGSPFALNENEGEVKGECTPDLLRSAGPDGILNTSDDIGINIETAFCQPGQP